MSWDLPAPFIHERVAVHGASVFVMGAAFFKSADYKKFVDGIRGQLSKLAAPSA